MASSFDRWEKDSFFSAAEEVQESADRIESTYRTWVHATKDASSIWNCDELDRDLRTALGTTKWQLEEFERAVKASYVSNTNEDARDRHREFILAIEDQISKTQSSLQEFSQSKGKPPLPWMRLDEGESNELALFLSGPSAGEDKTVVNNVVSDNENPQSMDEESAPACSINSLQPVEQGPHDDREEKSHGHRRTASASPDIGSWKIAISGVDFQQCPLNGQTQKLVRKIPSFSGFLNTVESASKFKWPKNGFRKLKVVDRDEETNSMLPSPQSARGIIVGYERSKSCIDSCDDFYDKQLYGWHGSIQRQFQRSIYQMQYSRPVRVTLSTVFIISIDRFPREVILLLKGLSLLLEEQLRQRLVKVIRSFCIFFSRIPILLCNSEPVCGTCGSWMLHFLICRISTVVSLHHQLSGFPSTRPNMVSLIGGSIITLNSYNIICSVSRLGTLRCDRLLLDIYHMLPLLFGRLLDFVFSYITFIYFFSSDRYGFGSTSCAVRSYFSSPTSCSVIGSRSEGGNER